MIFFVRLERIRRKAGQTSGPVLRDVLNNRAWGLRHKFPTLKIYINIRIWSKKNDVYLYVNICLVESVNGITQISTQICVEL